jgi:hypothetical protein
MNKQGRFPTTRRPKKRPLSTAPENEIEKWFLSTAITIGDAAETEEQRSQAKRLLYTWKDCFAQSVRDIKATDLIEH